MVNNVPVAPLCPATFTTTETGGREAKRTGRPVFVIQGVTLPLSCLSQVAQKA